MQHRHGARTRTGNEGFFPLQSCYPHSALVSDAASHTPSLEEQRNSTWAHSASAVTHPSDRGAGSKHQLGT